MARRILPFIGLLALLFPAAALAADSCNDSVWSNYGSRAAPVCACYHDGSYCDLKYEDVSDYEADCTVYCKLTYGDKYTSSAYHGNVESCMGQGVESACTAANATARLAETDSTVTAAISTGANIPSYPTPALNVDIPGVEFSKTLYDNGTLKSNFIGTYVIGMYKFLIGFAVTVAIVMMMVGGIQYVVGATAGDVGKAKERITNAITGLVLLLFVYVILFTVNPNLTMFKDLSIAYVPEIPDENFFDQTGADSMSCTASGADLTGVNSFQDCMIANYGASESEVQSQLVSIMYDGRTYQVHKLMEADFIAALTEVGTTGYDIASDTAGGTFNWRCNRNYPEAVSAHGWGTAIDINPSTNPNCPPACMDGKPETACHCVGGTSSVSCETMCASPKPYDIPQSVIDAFKSHGFTWGGSYSRTKDYMHFTYTRTCKGG
jgi:hypothetical protein